MRHIHKIILYYSILYTILFQGANILKEENNFTYSFTSDYTNANDACCMVKSGTFYLHIVGECMFPPRC